MRSLTCTSCIVPSLTNVAGHILGSRERVCADRRLLCPCALQCRKASTTSIAPCTTAQKYQGMGCIALCSHVPDLHGAHSCCSRSMHHALHGPRFSCGWGMLDDMPCMVHIHAAARACVMPCMVHVQAVAGACVMTCLAWCTFMLHLEHALCLAWSTFKLWLGHA
jgi:hypothetical protein